MTDAAAAPAGPTDPTVHPNYPVRCLGCGAALDVVAFPTTETAPWACVPCGRAFWPAELRAAMQHPDLYDPNVGWPSDVRTLAVLDACAQDEASAVIHGTSMLVEQLHMVDEHVLIFWRDHGQTTVAFRAQIQAHLDFRHYKPPKPTPKKATKRTSRKDS